MDKNTIIANIVAIGGIGACVAIAQLPFLYSVAVFAATVVGCAYLTSKDK